MISRRCDLSHPGKYPYFMCTLVVARDVFPGAPLVMAANRDEFLARPSAGPELWRDGPIPFVAPRDLLAGGTWLGVNARGVVAAITNRRAVPKRDDRRSRGDLVVLALSHATASAAAEAVFALDGAAFNGFHLTIADRHSAQIVWGDGERMRSRPLAAGIHVITEAGIEGLTHREQRASSFMERLSREIPDVFALRKLLTLHADDPFDGLCNHADAFGYGTKSSTIMTLGEDDISMWHCDERPCEGSFVDMKVLLRELREGQV